MQANVQLHHTISSAVSNTIPEQAWIDLICQDLAQYSATEIYDAIERERAVQTISEEYEEVLLSVLDILCGWCGPDVVLSRAVDQDIALTFSPEESYEERKEKFYSQYL